ncbi:MAG: phenylalanine 4-monooxygenase [Proteobacteria bacterium]|nr:phenylalanine 4-monooxygenase [Pseudomonadota bacterium]
MANYIAKKPDKNGIVDFTEIEHHTWSHLLERQMKVVQQRACDEFIHGLEKLNFPRDRIPQCHEVSEVLYAATGWSVAPVDAIIPLSEFFKLLSNRQFPAATFIRRPEDLDYLEEPDIFHEYFGHCPLLTNPAYADFVHWYGQSVLGMPKQLQSVLGRLFWFTIEFGLVTTERGLRIYGGGILSSFTETVYALEDSQVQRLDFNLLAILNATYRYDQIQKQYFVINNLDQLFTLKNQSIIEIAKNVAMGGKPENDFLIC